MVDKLSLYRGAALVLGDRTLDSLTDETELRRALDSAWDIGALDFCLSSGYWNFAMRTVEIPASEDTVPADWSYSNAFPKPSDWLRTAGISLDGQSFDPLLSYADEAGFWYADVDPLYVRYISNDVDYGGNMSRWSVHFVQFVEAYLASRIAIRVTGSNDKALMAESLADRKLMKARSLDSMDSPTIFPPTGSWVRSRFSGGLGLRRGY